MGLISFGNTATVEINLDDHDDVFALVSDISKVSWKNENSNTPDALREAKNEFLRVLRSVRRVALLITDGEANASPGELKVNAEALRGDGVEVLAIGVGLGANFIEAEVIAGSFSRVYIRQSPG